LAAARAGADDALTAAARDIDGQAHIQGLAEVSFPAMLHPSSRHATSRRAGEPASRERVSSLAVLTDERQVGRR
jgi:hypothetical protein